MKKADGVCRYEPVGEHDIYYTDPEKFFKQNDISHKITKEEYMKNRTRMFKEKILTCRMDKDDSEFGIKIDSLLFFEKDNFKHITDDRFEGYTLKGEKFNIWKSPYKLYPLEYKETKEILTYYISFKDENDYEALKQKVIDYMTTKKAKGMII